VYARSLTAPEEERRLLGGRVLGGRYAGRLWSRSATWEGLGTVPGGGAEGDDYLPRSHEQASFGDAERDDGGSGRHGADSNGPLLPRAQLAEGFAEIRLHTRTDAAGGRCLTSVATKADARPQARAPQAT